MSIPLPICYLTGYVGFSAEGGSPARFLQAAADSGIPLWHVRREGITLSACCAARHYARLRRPARRAGLRLHLTRRRGLAFHLRRLRGYAGLRLFPAGRRRGALTARSIHEYLAWTPARSRSHTRRPDPDTPSSPRRSEANRSCQYPPAWR